MRVEYNHYQNIPLQHGSLEYRIDNFVVTGDTTNNISLPTITVSGTVTDPSGQPVSGAHLEFSGNSNNNVYQFYANVYTDANGSYSREILTVDEWDSFSVYPPEGNTDLIAFSLADSLSPITSDTVLPITFPGTVTADTTPPNIVAPSNISIETTDSAGKIFVYDTPAASDNVEVTVGPTCTPASGTLLPVGVTTITCTAADSSGNVATASFTVTVVNTAATGDTSPPVLSQISTIVKETTLSNGAVVTYNHPITTDNEAVTYGPVCLPSSGVLFSVGTTTVTCIAKDAAGNQGSSSFDIIVVGPGSTIEEKHCLIPA